MTELRRRVQDFVDRTNKLMGERACAIRKDRPIGHVKRMPN